MSYVSRCVTRTVLIKMLRAFQNKDVSYNTYTSFGKTIMAPFRSDANGILIFELFSGMTVIMFSHFPDPSTVI